MAFPRIGFGKPLGRRGALFFRLILLLWAPPLGAQPQEERPAPGLSPFDAKALAPGFTLALGAGRASTQQGLHMPGFLENLYWATGNWYTLEAELSYRPRPSLRLGLGGGYQFPSSEAFLPERVALGKSYGREEAAVQLGEWRFSADWLIPFPIGPTTVILFFLRLDYYGSYHSWALPKGELTWASLYQVPSLGLGFELLGDDGWRSFTVVNVSYLPLLSGEGSLEGEAYRARQSLGLYGYVRAGLQKALGERLALALRGDMHMQGGFRRAEGRRGGQPWEVSPQGSHYIRFSSALEILWHL